MEAFPPISDRWTLEWRGFSLSNMRRSLKRRRVLKSGVIEFGSKCVSTIPCSVRNISDSGAGLEMNSPLWFPDDVTLSIASDAMRKPCRVVWRRARFVGVAFTEGSEAA